MTYVTLRYNGREQTYDTNDPDELDGLVTLVRLLSENGEDYEIDPALEDIDESWTRVAQHVESRTDKPTPNPVTDGGNEVVAETGITSEHKLALYMTVKGEHIKIGDTREPGRYQLLRVGEE